MEIPARTLLIGIGATALVDLWAIVRKHLLHVAPPDYALVGRWLGHIANGRIRHASITASAALRGELAFGWAFHYATGAAFAVLLVAIAGPAWLDRPTPGIAIAFGLATVAAPFLIMQPAMGAGIAAARMPDPFTARMRSLVTHGVFGLGLYLAALAVKILADSTGD